MLICENGEEAALLSKFRNYVQDLNQDEETLLRFLRARDGDLRKAGDMLRKNVEWRTKNNVESYLLYVPPKLIDDDMVYEFCTNRSAEGYPIAYVPGGRWNVIKSLSEHFDECYKTRFFLFEKGHQFIKDSGKDRIILILDLTGLTYKKVTHLDSIQLALTGLKDVEANYPERLECCYVINLHWLFSHLYGILVKPFLSKNTISKLQIFDTNASKWMPALLERIPEKSLPLDLQKIYRDMAKP